MYLSPMCSVLFIKTKMTRLNIDASQDNPMKDLTLFLSTSVLMSSR